MRGEVPWARSEKLGRRPRSYGWLVRVDTRPSPTTAKDELRRRVAAFEQTVRSSIALSAGFTDADWELPTECPGWTVKDQYSHITGVERLLLGDHEDVPEFPAELPHVRNELGLLMEHAVQTRRPRPGRAVVEELSGTLERRLAALADVDPATRIECPDGQVGDYVRFMAFRALDCWTHELDIRRAVRRPGNFGSPAALCFWELLGNGLRNVVARFAKLEPGRSAEFTICGPISFHRTILVDEDGRGQITDQARSADVALRMDIETYVRLATGRCGPGSVHVDVDGDRDLAARILANMTLTP